MLFKIASIKAISKFFWTAGAITALAHLSTHSDKSETSTIKILDQFEVKELKVNQPSTFNSPIKVPEIAKIKTIAVVEKTKSKAIAKISKTKNHFAPEYISSNTSEPKISIEIDNSEFENIDSNDMSQLAQLVEYPTFYANFDDEPKVVDIQEVKKQNRLIASNEYSQKKVTKIEVKTEAENTNSQITLSDAEPLDITNGLEILKSMDIQPKKLTLKTQAPEPKQEAKEQILAVATKEPSTEAKKAEPIDIFKYFLSLKAKDSAAQKTESKQNTQTATPKEEQSPIQQEVKVNPTPAPERLAQKSMSDEYSIVGYSGMVSEAFSMGKKPLEGVYVQILGTPWSTKTDQNGFFKFDKVHVVGVLPVILSLDGFMKRRIDLAEGKQESVELVSEASAQWLGLAASQKVASGSAFIYGQLDSNEEKLAGLKVELINSAGINQNSVVYLNDNGIPDKELEQTSSRGQFLFINIPQGDYLVATKDKNGLDRAPHLIHLSTDEGMVRKFFLGNKMSINGRISNGSNNSQVAEAKVQLMGTNTIVQTQSNGDFEINNVYIDCFDHNFIQIEKSGYYRNRTQYYCNKQRMNYFVFNTGYVDGLSADAQHELNPNTALLIGNTKFNQSVKVQLWGPDEVDQNSGVIRGKDFYLESDGVLNPELNRSIKNGNFAILDAPQGLSYLQAFDQENNTLMYWPLYFTNSTVNVFVH